MTTRDAIPLRGNAGSLTTLIRGGAQPLMLLPVRWQGSGDVIASYRPRAGGLGDIRFALPPRTPPGTYEATVLLPDGEQPLVLEVMPRPRLSFHPRVVWMSGGTATVTALNEGNAPVVIPRSGEVALYAQNDNAFERALRGERKDGECLIDTLVEGLAGTFVGTVRLSVESGDGLLADDDARELTLVMHLPEGLKSETTYDGEWTVDGGSLSISVQTPASNEEPNP